MSLFGGIIAGAMSGVGEAGKEIADESIKMRDKQSLLDQQSQLELQKAQAIEQFKNELANEPANRAGRAIADALKTQVPDTATPASPANPSSTTHAPVPAPQTADDKSGPVTATSAVMQVPPAVQAARDALRLTMLQNELNDEKDLENRARLQRDIDRTKLALGPSTTAAPVVADVAASSGDSSAASGASGLDEPVPVKMRNRTQAEAMEVARQALLANGDLIGAEKVKAATPDKYIQIGKNGLLNAQTNEIIQPNSATGREALPAEAANAEWLLKHGITDDPKTAWKMAHKLQANENIGDPDLNEKIAAMVASGDASASTVLGKLPSAQKLQILARAKEINPEYKQQDYATQQKTLNDFSTGQQGKAVNSFNVGLAHLDQLGKLGDALENGNMQVFNKIGNTVTSWTGGAAPTNFDAVKHIVAAELVKAVTGSAGALGDREALDATLKNVNSPTQLRGVVDTYKGLMVGQLHGLQKQYEVGTGRNDFHKKLSSEAQALSGIGGVASPAKPTASSIAQVGNDADYNALPSGSMFTGPDGHIRRKP